jgi:hypothetical protein
MLSSTGSAADAKCSLRHIAQCQNSNALYWSDGFNDKISALVSRAHRVAGPKPPERNRLSGKDVYGAIGNVPQGVDKFAGFTLFHGNAVHAGMVGGTVAVSNAGQILGFVVEMPSLKNDDPGAYAVQLYLAARLNNPAVEDSLIQWANSAAKSWWKITLKETNATIAGAQPVIRITTYQYSGS